MSNNLHSLFSGAFYIDAMYGMSCVPSLYKSLVKDSIEEKTKDERINAISAESTSNNYATEKKVAVINFNQPVVKYDYGSWLGTQSYIQILENLKNNPNIAGVVLDTDTGGGQVYGTGEFYDYITEFKKSKPIVLYTNGYLCSGGYYFAAPCSFIIANKRADAIGSIGAYSTIVDSAGILEHFGAKIHTMYGTKSTEKNSDYREVIENSNYEPYIKNQLDPIIETFHSDMKASRPQLNEEVFKGGTWTGVQAKELGLIDETGTLQTAIDKVFELSNADTKTNNTNTMSKEIKAPSIQNALGYDTPFASNENGVFLQESEIETVENALTTANTNVTNITAERDTANTSVENATTAIDAALTTAEIDFTPEMSLSEKINALENQRATFAKKANGGKTTVVNTGTDEDPAGEPKQVVYAHVAEANKLLGINN